MKNKIVFISFIGSILMGCQHSPKPGSEQVFEPDQKIVLMAEGSSKCRIHGRLIDEKTKLPIAGACIKGGEPIEGGVSRSGWAFTFSDQDGFFNNTVFYGYGTSHDMSEPRVKVRLYSNLEVMKDGYETVRFSREKEVYIFEVEVIDMDFGAIELTPVIVEERNKLNDRLRW